MMYVHHICIQTNVYPQSLILYQQLELTPVEETPNFQERSVNAWLWLQNFHIELQTEKTILK